MMRQRFRADSFVSELNALYADSLEASAAVGSSGPVRG